MLSNKQFGFREKTSTSDAIAQLTKDIYEAMDNSKPSLCIFIDLAKAFDTISHKEILEKLENYGIRGICHDLMKSYLSDRKQHVKIANFLSEPRTVLCGLPQGTVLAPILFITFLNDLLTLNIKGKIISFADDTSVFYSGNSWDEIRQTATKELRILKDWFDENLLTINITKTTYLPFSSYKNSLPHFTEINIKDTNFYIQACSSVNYLGVILDAHLKWDHQINHATKKLRSLLYRFKQIKDVLKNKKHLKIIYSGMIESILRYGIVGWGAANKTNLKPLEIIQKRYLKILYEKGFFYPSNLLYAESEFLNIRQLYCINILNSHFKHFDQTQILSHNYETRKKQQQNVMVKTAQKTIGMKNYTYLAPRLYNILPDTIRQIRHYKKYKYEVKKWIQLQDYKKVNNFVDTGSFN